MVSLSILRNFLYPSPYACFWETLSPLNKGEEETMMDFWQFRKHNPEFNFSLKQKRVQKGLAQKELGSKPETVSFIWWSIYLIFSTNFGKLVLSLTPKTCYSVNLYTVIRFLLEKVILLFAPNESSDTEFTRKKLKPGVV